MKLTVGQRLASTVCDTEVIVLRAGADDVELTCGAAAMVDTTDPAAHGGEAIGADGDGTVIGKRYVDTTDTLELLCTKPGAGTLRVGEPLSIKAAKTLPSSD